MDDFFDLNNEGFMNSVNEPRIIYDYKDYTLVWIVLVLVIIAGVVYVFVTSNAWKKEIETLKNASTG